ncbi:unnamed protein product [Cuscuta campestris]|uniref:Uncharacterized protein n=1 Tax=Cuscuta campestris TaxID=132261 RepID=A0A484L5A5_9ASTE|nr:unnamed protein product [Cuscuta campestris]
MAGMDRFGFDAHTRNGSSSETPFLNVSARLGGSVGQTTPINVPFGSSAAVGSTPITTFMGSSATMGSALVTLVIRPTAAMAAMVTPLRPNMASAIPVIPSLEPNTGVFTSAPQRMLFWLTTLNLARYLREDPLVVGKNVDEAIVQAKEAWITDNYTCLNLILNFLSDALYAVYSRAASAKELWTTLSNKCQAEGADAKKFVVGKVLDFKMVDSKPVVSQAKELILIFNECTHEGMGVSEAFQVVAIIHVLPQAWDEFQSYLKLKRKEMTLEQLLVYLWIREEGLTRKKKVAIAKANMVEHPPKEGSSKGPKPNKDKKKIGPKGGVAKTKFAGKCYRSSECRKKP